MTTDGLEFWEAGECLTDFPDALHDEQWERNHTVPIVYSPKKVTFSVPPARLPPSPTPSFVRFFEGQCLCEQCNPRGPINYPPGVEAEKRKVYDAWINEKAKQFEQKRLEHRKVFSLPLKLRRRRAILVVQGALGLDEDEMREYDEESYDGWWESLQSKFKAEEDRNRLDYGQYRWDLPSWYSFCEY